MVQSFRIVAASLVLATAANVSAEEQPRPVTEELVVDDAGTATVDVVPADGYSEAVGGIVGEQLYPYDAPEPWRHGYFQEIPAYGGFFSFRPYNYKHVLAQSQAAGGWGMSPRMPYSQQFWHRYQKKAAMQPLQSRRFSRDDNVGVAKLRDRALHPVRNTPPLRVIEPVAYPPVKKREGEAPAEPQSVVFFEENGSAGASPSHEIGFSPVAYPPVSRLEALRYRMQQQARQMQALQQAYRHEYQTEAALHPVAVPLER